MNCKAHYRIIALSLGLSSGSEAIILGFPAMHTLNTQDALPWELRQYTQSHSEEKASL